MKFLLLAGTLGAIMLFAIVPSVSNNAYANIFLIDNFTGDTALPQKCDQMLFNGTLANQTAFESQSGLSEVIDMIRECQLFLLIDNAPSVGASTIEETAAMYRHMSGPGVSIMSYLQYDGMADAVVGGGRTLDLNLLDSDNLVIQYSFADFEVN